MQTWCYSLWDGHIKGIGDERTAAMLAEDYMSEAIYFQAELTIQEEEL